MTFKLNTEYLETTFKKPRWPSGFHWLSQGEKAQMIGVSQAMVSRLESGKKSFNDVSVKEFLAICEAMGCSPYEFLERQ